jgi:hypothetical protein
MSTYHNVEKGYVPDSLFDIWKAKHGGDPIVDYKNETDKGDHGTGIGSILCLFFGAIAFTGYRWPSHGNNPVSMLMLSVGLIFLGVVYGGIALFRKDPEDNNGYKCYREIGWLFGVFDAEPSEEIGKLSLEEFRGLIEDALTKQAKAVDNATGFDKVNQRKKFNDMHKIALEWGLCHESHARYYPQKNNLFHGSAAVS